MNEMDIKEKRKDGEKMLSRIFLFRTWKKPEHNVKCIPVTSEELNKTIPTYKDYLTEITERPLCKDNPKKQ